jgi:hypothetical protein
MPPIPDDAVVIADYMLMADFVPAASVDAGAMSKGVRYNHASRDIFYDSGAAITYNMGYTGDGYQWVSMYNNNAASEARITAFGTAYGQHYWRGTNRPANTQARLDGVNYTYVVGDLYDSGGEWDDTNDDGTLSKAGAAAFGLFGIKNQVLGNHTFGDKLVSGGGESGKYNAWSAFEVATPIHTSSHYQAFETPFLHELVGGDRNMEQTNLVVTPDGKTWDEVTRDVGYLGPSTIAKATLDGGHPNGAVIWDIFRGTTNADRGFESIFKNIAYGYNRFIILKSGYYKIHLTTYSNASTAGAFYIMHNSASTNNMPYLRVGTLADQTESLEHNLYLMRGDFIMASAENGPQFHGTALGYTWIELEKISD